MLLGINEPNMQDQGLCPARLAAKYFKDLNERYPNKIMISPATAHVDTEWFDEFWDECQKLECRIDYLATHQYSGSPLQRIEELQKYSERLDLFSNLKFQKNFITSLIFKFIVKGMIIRRFG